MELESLWDSVKKFMVWDKLYVLNNGFSFFCYFHWGSQLFMSLQIKNSNFGLCLYINFKASSNLFINWLKSAEDNLYKLEHIKFYRVNSDALVSSWIGQISETCSIQRSELLILL